MAEFFSAVGDFISLVVSGITQFVSLIGNGVSFIQQFLTFIPGPLSVLLLSALALMIAIAVLKLL